MFLPVFVILSWCILFHNGLKMDCHDVSFLFHFNVLSPNVKPIIQDIQDFKMPNGLAPCFIAKYVKPYEILRKPHLNIHKLSTKFVSHPTFHILKLKLFLHDELWPERKQKV
jgi:hypothetical protein